MLTQAFGKPFGRPTALNRRSVDQLELHCGDELEW